MIVLLFFSCYVCVISANPLAQLLLQTNPNILQNGFNNAPTSFPQANNLQPYSSPVSVQNAVNNCQCKEPFFARNQSPNQIVQASPNNRGNQQNLNKILENPIFKFVLDPKFASKQNIGNICTGANQASHVSTNNQNQQNKMLANPILQMMLDPKTKLYNQNGVEISKQNLANTGTGPNIINNYYILTPECLNLAENGINHQKTKNPKRGIEVESRRREGNGNTKKQKSNKIKNDNEPKRDNNDNLEINPKTIGKQVNPSENTPIEQEQKMQERPRNKKNGRRRSDKRPKNSDCGDHKEVILIPEELPIDKPSVIEDTKQERRSKGKQKDIQVTDSKDEAVIKNMHSKFPGIPENIIRNLLNYLKRQQQSNKLSNNGQSPNIENPLRYDKLFSQLSNIDSNKNKGKSRRRNPRRKNKKPKNTSTEESDITEEPLTTTDNPVTTSSTTTEKTVDDNNEEQIPIRHQEKGPEEKVYEVEGRKPITFDTEIERPQTTTEKTMPTKKRIDKIFPILGEEDVIHVFPENFVDDYYPDFRADNVYFENDEDYVRNHRDNSVKKKHDSKLNGNIKMLDETTEYHFDLSESKETLKKHGKTDMKDHEDVSIREESIGDTKLQVNTPSSKEEVLEFKSPPLLENPDFQTKSIKNRFNIDELYEPDPNKVDSMSVKSSTYSSVKQVDQVSKPRNVETVFAGSKVAKYGQTDALESPELFSSDDPVYVYGRYISSEEFW